MATGWMTALRFIPWGDVIEAAPHVAKSARRLFSATQDDAAQPVVAPAPPPSSAPDAERIHALEARIEGLQASLAALAQEQRASAELVDSLAQHNARIVEAIAIMRVRSKVLLWLCAGLGAALLALGVWIGVR